MRLCVFFGLVISQAPPRAWTRVQMHRRDAARGGYRQQTALPLSQNGTPCGVPYKFYALICPSGKNKTPAPLTSKLDALAWRLSHPRVCTCGTPPLAAIDRERRCRSHEKAARGFFCARVLCAAKRTSFCARAGFDCGPFAHLPFGQKQTPAPLTSKLDALAWRLSNPRVCHKRHTPCRLWAWVTNSKRHPLRSAFCYW